MTKLAYAPESNTYTVNRGKPFTEHLIDPEDVFKAIGFAYDMVYGEGHHRDHRTGGSAERTKGEKFCNTFQGKLAEIILHGLLSRQGIALGELDFGIYGEGIWDDCDISANGKRISVKSAASFSSLLLLEAEDWDAAGNYLPAAGNGHYDYFVLVRFKPDIKGVFSLNHMFFSDDQYDRQLITDMVLDKNWCYDIPGCISNKTLQHIIASGYVLPKNALLGEKTRMDASNYYIQAGEMPLFEDLVRKLKEKK